MGDSNMQTSEELLREMGLEDPNFDSNLNEDDRQNPEVVVVESSDINLDKNAQCQNEKDRAEEKRANDLAERKRKHELANECERASRELAAERERKERMSIRLCSPQI